MPAMGFARVLGLPMRLRGFALSPLLAVAVRPRAALLFRFLHSCPPCAAARPKKGSAAAASSDGEPAFIADGDEDTASLGSDPASLRLAMNKSVDYVKREFARLRGGTPSPRESAARGAAVRARLLVPAGVMAASLFLLRASRRAAL